MCKGDLTLLYHSNCNAIGIAGIMIIARAGYTDYPAFDPDSNRYDAANFRDNPRWYNLNVRYKRTLKHIISLAELRAQSELKDIMRLLKDNRLSVIPVTNQQWDFILTLE
jgi:predicted RNA-binding protein with PUA-like domain